MAATKWIIDPLHSEIQFKVKHLVISTVTGTFKTFGGEVTSATGDFEDAAIKFSIDVNSVDTNQPQRDAHLKNGDFFEADKFPEISFQSTSFKKTSGDEYTLAGDLTMRGVTKPVAFKVEFGGSAKDFQGNLKYGFEVTGTVNRKEFGVSFNRLTDTGGLALGEEVKLIANIQVAQEAVAA
jgi:polyisoprenoid-binding protein YceI